MSDDSYVPEKEEAESSSDHLFYADNSPVENTESRLSPMTYIFAFPFIQNLPANTSYPTNERSVRFKSIVEE